MNVNMYKDGMVFENDEYRLQIVKVTESGIDCVFSSVSGEYWEYEDIDSSSVKAILEQFNL